MWDSSNVSRTITLIPCLIDSLYPFKGTGTTDPVPFLSVDAALDFRESIGGEQKINEYCHSLALQGGRRLAEVLGTRVLDETGEFTANMVSNNHAINKMKVLCDDDRDGN